MELRAGFTLNIWKLDFYTTSKATLKRVVKGGWGRSDKSMVGDGKS